MSLGRFGGSELILPHLSGGGGGVAIGASIEETLQSARDQLLPSTEGTRGVPSQLLFQSGGYGSNQVKNGSFESWSSGTSSVPDGWVLTGAGATVSRDTTNVQRDLAAVDIAAAVNTATDLAQIITISATQNTQLRGRTFTFSAQVKSATSGRAFVKIDDGVNTASSDFQTGENTFELLFITMTIDSAATKIECSIEISSGAVLTITADAAMLAEGDTPVGFSPHFSDGFLTPLTYRATGQPTTTSASAVDTGTGTQKTEIPNVNLNGSQSAILMAQLAGQIDTAANRIFLTFARDSTGLSGAETDIASHTANIFCTGTIVAIDRLPAAGIYTYKLQWSVSGGFTATAGERSIHVMVVPTL